MNINFFVTADLSDDDRKRLCERSGLGFRQLIQAVEPIIDDVKSRGDEALSDYTLRFDGVRLSHDEFRVSKSSIEDAIRNLQPELKQAMVYSIENIKKFHESQKGPEIRELEIVQGVTAGERTIPVESVGLYIPRGKGSFPSMMMMAAVPAKVAGVKRIVAVSPPDRSGKPDHATIAAAGLIGVDEFYIVGGAQAIAALAYGTETIKSVHKIVGPGSGYVLAAKQLISIEIDTGLPAGPSESIILADSSADPLLAATDLLIEAEHGPDSSAYLVTPDKYLAQRALEILPMLIKDLPEERRSYCETVLSNSGGVVLAADIDDAIRFVNEFAPEHLQIMTRNPREHLLLISTAGEALLGPFTPGTLANYSIGPNAILPTSGFGRTTSALSVSDFTRKMSFAEVTEEGFMNMAQNTLVLAEYEGFPAHAQAIRLRLNLGSGN